MVQGAKWQCQVRPAAHPHHHHHHPFAGCDAQYNRAVVTGTPKWFARLIDTRAAQVTDEAAWLTLFVRNFRRSGGGETILAANYTYVRMRQKSPSSMAELVQTRAELDALGACAGAGGGGWCVSTPRLAQGSAVR